MHRLIFLVFTVSIVFLLCTHNAGAQNSVRVYTLSDGTKVAGEIIIDSGTHIMVKDPLTGQSRTIERTSIVSISDGLTEIDSLRPAHLRFDHERFSDQVDLVVPSSIEIDATDEVWILWVPRSVVPGQDETLQAHESCLLIAAPGVLVTPTDKSGAFTLRLVASRLLPRQTETPSNVGSRPAQRTATNWVEYLNTAGIYGLFADGQVRRLEMATRDASGALALQKSTKYGPARSEVSVPCGWVPESDKGEPDLWVHALDAQYAEKVRQATAAYQMIRRARQIQESLGSRVPVYDSRCDGDGILLPNQRSMFTLSEESEYQDKLRRALASIPSSGTYMHSVEINVTCSTCKKGIKSYRRPTETYSQAAREHVALLRRAEQLANELTADVARKRDGLRMKRTENYSQDAAIAELEAAEQQIREWVSIIQEIDASEKRLRDIQP